MFPMHHVLTGIICGHLYIVVWKGLFFLHSLEKFVLDAYVLSIMDEYISISTV